MNLVGQVQWSLGYGEHGHRRSQSESDAVVDGSANSRVCVVPCCGNKLYKIPYGRDKFDGFFTGKVLVV